MEPMGIKNVKTIAAAIMTEKRVITTKERDKGQGTADQKECDAMYAHRMEDLLGACWQDQSIDLKRMNVVCLKLAPWCGQKPQETRRRTLEGE